MASVQIVRLLSISFRRSWPCRRNSGSWLGRRETGQADAGSCHQEGRTPSCHQLAIGWSPIAGRPINSPAGHSSQEYRRIGSQYFPKLQSGFSQQHLAGGHRAAGGISAEPRPEQGASYLRFGAIFVGVDKNYTAYFCPFPGITKFFFTRCFSQKLLSDSTN